MPSTRPRRSIFSLLIAPFKQIRFGIHVSLVSVFFSIVLILVVIRAFYKQYEQVIDWFKVANIEELMDNQVIIQNTRLVLSIIILMVISIHWVIFRRTHKMYGPMVAIQRFLDRLKKGQFDARIVIREKDDFHELVKQLNDLAKILEETFGNEVTLKTSHSKASDKVQESKNKSLNQTGKK